MDRRTRRERAGEHRAFVHRFPQARQGRRGRVHGVKGRADLYRRHGRHERSREERRRRRAVGAVRGARHGGGHRGGVRLERRRERVRHALQFRHQGHGHRQRRRDRVHAGDRSEPHRLLPGRPHALWRRARGRSRRRTKRLLRLHRPQPDAPPHAERPHAHHRRGRQVQLQERACGRFGDGCVHVHEHWHGRGSNGELLGRGERLLVRHARHRRQLQLEL